VRYNKVFCILALAVIFSLLVLVIPAAPALAATGTVSIYPTGGPVGTTVTVNGTDFTPVSTYTVKFGSTEVATGTCDGGGGFSVTFSVPTKARGQYAVMAITDAPDTSGPINFTLTPKVILSTSSGGVGDTVTVDGTGFKASSSVIIYFDSTSVGTATTDANGSFNDATFTVPQIYKGNHTVKGQDTDGDSPTVNFTVTHKITITPTSGAPGITVTVNGSGFGASKPITIKYNAAVVTTTPATTNTDATGSFTASFTVPTSVAGTYAVEASDGTYSASANFAITINITLSEITSEASPGHVGMEITISGTGFKPDSQIKITYTSTPIEVATTSSNNEGAFSATFKIPKSAHGTHTIKASDGTNTLQATFFMEQTAPATPKLQLPTNGEEAESRAVFDWETVTKDVNDADEPSTPVTYDLQIASDADFSNIVLEKTELTTSGYTLLKGERLESTEKEAPYYWRVRAVDAASNANDWTSSRTFYVGGSGWVLYCLIGAGVLLIFFLGFWAGRRSKRSEYY
jgi:hypothetical protein